MFGCRNLNVRVSNSSVPILKGASVDFEGGKMHAVIGPSGCGKTTLVKAMLGIIPSEGDSYFRGRRIADASELAGKVGFAPQFTCVHPKLTVREALKSSLDLSLLDEAEKLRRMREILEITGLEEHADKLVESLSGGQLRRIGLGVELANDPEVLVCDEVTSGLDPLSENAILDLLKKLCLTSEKTFVCIIHNLAKLDYFDSISVVYEGEIVFRGTLPELKKYFGIESALHLYDELNRFDISHWKSRWLEEGSPLPEKPEELEGKSEYSRPSMLSQTSTLLSRRYRLFFRDKTYFLLTLAITFGFPIVVVIFALGGLPQIEGLALERNLGAIDEMKESLRAQIEAVETSTLVTGLILFQVVLLALMGSNNSAREIAGERNLYEKERMFGLRPSAYALSKILFTSSLAVFQGVWMCAFVKYVCGFPSSFFEQAMSLTAVCVSMTCVCLAFSSLFSSADKANLVSIYLVGFQLPLSGVVLALPEALRWICRPFIATYWGWAGYINSMSDTRIYDAFMLARSEWESMPSTSLCVAVLAVQAVAAIAFVFVGVNRRSWN